MLDNNNKLLRKIEENTRNGNTGTGSSVDLSSIEERLTNLENRTDNDTIYDDSSILERLTSLEQNTGGSTGEGSNNIILFSTDGSIDEIFKYHDDTENLGYIHKIYNEDYTKLRKFFIIDTSIMGNKFSAYDLDGDYYTLIINESKNYTIDDMTPDEQGGGD